MSEAAKLQGPAGTVAGMKKMGGTCSWECSARLYFCKNSWRLYNVYIYMIIYVYTYFPINGSTIMFNMNIVLNSIFDAYQNTHVIWKITGWHGLFIYIHAHWNCSTAHLWWGSACFLFCFFVHTLQYRMCPFLCASKKKRRKIYPYRV